MIILNRDREILRSLLDNYGRDALEDEIKSVDTRMTSELTIIANGGLHPVPSDYIFGELYVASEGNLDFSDINSVNREIDLILFRLRKVLKAHRWSKIYLIPFGHAIISMNIKMAVYRTLRIETADIFYFGEVKYGVLERDTRQIMLR